MAKLLPAIESSGRFEAEAPYDALISSDVAYTCISLRTISEVVSTGGDLWAEYYQKYGISEVRFAKDIEENATIVGLQAGTGEVVNLPSTFLTTVPVVDGQTYTTLILGVSLGAVPDDFRIAPLVTSIENIVLSTLGIKPNIKPVTTSVPFVIPHEEHTRLQTARQVLITSKETDYTRAERLQKELDVMITRNKALGDYIKENHPPT